MASTASDMVILGEVTSPFGTHGWLKIQSFTEPPEALFNYTDLYYQLQGYWLPLTITDHQTQKNHFIITVQQVQDTQQASNLRHCSIATPRHELPPAPNNCYYWHDLIGCIVYNQQDTYLGRIIQFLPTGGKDVMIVEDQQRHLIPFVQDVFISTIDLHKRQIIVDWDI